MPVFGGDGLLSLLVNSTNDLVWCTGWRKNVVYMKAWFLLNSTWGWVARLGTIKNQNRLIFYFCFSYLVCHWSAHEFPCILRNEFDSLTITWRFFHLNLILRFTPGWDYLLVRLGKPPYWLLYWSWIYNAAEGFSVYYSAVQIGWSNVVAKLCFCHHLTRQKQLLLHDEIFLSPQSNLRKYTKAIIFLVNPMGLGGSWSIKSFCLRKEGHKITFSREKQVL